MERAVFLDRDGVISENVEVIKSTDDIKILPGSQTAVKILNELGFKVIIATNQPNVAKGRCSEDDVRVINNVLKKELEINGGKIDEIYYCPHHPEKGFPGENPSYKTDCDCRKPKTGMLIKARDELKLDLNSSFLIGDRTVDIKTGIDAGCKTILVNTGYGGSDKKFDVKADYSCSDILEAAKLIKVLEEIRGMKCLILAGGKGERLRPLTDRVPKPMLQIDGKPILEHQIGLLKKHGITDVVICGHYLFDEIRNYFKDGSRFGVKIDYCYENSPLGTGGAIKNAESLVDNNLLVLYGDEIIDLDIERLIRFHKEKNAAITMVLHETDHPHDSDLAALDGDSRVIEFYRRPNITVPSRLSKSSVYVIEPFVFKDMPKGRFDFDTDFIFKYIEGGSVYGYVTDEFIKDIGTMERLKMVDEKIKKERLDKLKQNARIIRKHVIRMTSAAGSGHPGGSLSCVDILTALYFRKMRYDPKNPKWDERDRFVLSKGHAAPALYATLAEAGFFPVSELEKLRKIDSMLQGHPSVITPGVEICSGSLGQGLSVANGMALAGKIDKKDYRVYVIIGDGESQEGQIWEAAMTASHYKLNNLTAILDRNGLQIDGKTEDMMSLEPLADKWRAFGWDVIEVDGHSFEELINALDKESDRPKMIIAYTVKGKGVSFMEHNADFHGKVTSKEETEKALMEIGD